MAQPLLQAQDIAKKLGRSVDSLSVKELYDNGMDLGSAITVGGYNAKMGTTGAPTTTALSPAQKALSAFGGAASGLTGQTGPAAVGALGAVTGATTKPDMIKTTMQPQSPAPSATPKAQTQVTMQAPAPDLPQTQPFAYRPNTRTDADLLAAARARAALLIGTQRQDAQAGFAQQQQLAQQQGEELNRTQATNEEATRQYWASRNLGNSGFLAGANALGQAATQRERGKIDAQVGLAQQALSDRLAQLNQMQAQSEVANYDQLLNQERQYGLQDRAQQFGEYTSNRDYGLRESDLGSVLAQRAFDLSRGKQMLPYEVGQAQLGLQTGQAQYNDQYTPGGLGYQYRQGQIAGQDIANRSAQTQYQDTYQPGGIGYQARQEQLTGAQLANQKVKYENQIAELQGQIAANPDTGLAAQARVQMQQAQANLRQIDSQIAANNALAQQRQASPSTNPEDKDRTARIAQNVKDFKVSRNASELWEDYLDIVGSGKSNGSPYTPGEATQIYQQMLSRANGLVGNDKAWLQAMANGAPETELQKYRRTTSSQGSSLEDAINQMLNQGG